jgi:hypothetical protein
MEKKLLVNSVITPDGTRICSCYRHDYATHKDANGETYSVDGGLTYLRRSVNKEPAKEASLYTDDPHEEIRKYFKWGTRGKGGRDPLKWVALCDLAIDHIEAILATQMQLSEALRGVFTNELAYRKNEMA